MTTILSDGRGGWFIGGEFDHVGDVTTRGVVHLGSDGRPDTRWKPALPPGSHPVRGGVSSTGEAVYVALPDGVAALDARTGARRWFVRARKRPSSQGIRSVAAGKRAVYVGGGFDRIAGTLRHDLAALSPKTGRPLSRFPQADGTVYAISLAGRYLYATGLFTTLSDDGADGVKRVGLERVDTATGRVSNWRPAPPVFYIERMIVAQGQVVTWSLDGFVVWDARTGKRRDWPNEIDGADGSPDRFAAVGKTLYIAGDGRYWFSAVAGKPRHNIAAVTLPSGKVTGWRPRLRRQPCIDAIGADGKRVLVAAVISPPECS